MNTQDAQTEIAAVRENERFYPAKERKNDFVITVEYLQWGSTKHTHKKGKGKRILGMIAWDIPNPNYTTQEEFEKQICQCKSDRFEKLTRMEIVYE